MIMLDGRRVGQRRAKSENIEAGYSDSMVAREKVANLSLGDSVALLHVLPEDRDVINSRSSTISARLVTAFPISTVTRIGSDQLGARMEQAYIQQAAIYPYLYRSFL